MYMQVHVHVSDMLSQCSLLRVHVHMYMQIHVSDMLSQYSIMHVHVHEHACAHSNVTMIMIVFV